MEQVSKDRTKHKGEKSNGKGVVELTEPFAVEVTIRGVEPMLCHRYDAESVASKAAAKKGSNEKKTDNVESYVYRLDDGTCGFPAVNFKAALCMAAKFTQDPRSPRKSAYDLFRAGVKVRNDASFGKATWDYLDKRRVQVQRNAVARVRPAFNAGWELTYVIEVLLPEYISQELLNEIVVRTGRLIGLGDFRPDFGTFMVMKYEVLTRV